MHSDSGNPWLRKLKVDRKQVDDLEPGDCVILSHPDPVAGSGLTYTVEGIMDKPEAGDLKLLVSWPDGAHTVRRWPHGARGTEVVVIIWDEDRSTK